MSNADRFSADGRAHVTSWLTGLFLLLLLLVSVGGFVRLSGSGLSLPGWPQNNGAFLPPLGEQEWAACYELFLDDQERLREAIKEGKTGVTSLGRQPADMAEFKFMYMVEWSHRFMAAIVGIAAFACMVMGLRHPSVRQLAGGKLVAIVALLSLQAVLGAVLVFSGTATHWLFLHLGLATVILALITWTILRLLHGGPSRLSEEVHSDRLGLRQLASVAMILVIVQIILGGLVAGSRASGFAADWPTMHGQMVPDLWVHERSMVWNLIDNWVLHQWVHRWFAWVVAGVLILLAVQILRRGDGIRARMASQVCITFLVLQIGLGLANVLLYVPTVIALAHLVTGMLTAVVVVLINFDLRNEPIAAPAMVQDDRRQASLKGA